MSISLLLVTLFIGPLAIIAVYGVCQAHLAWKYLLAHAAQRRSGGVALGDLRLPGEQPRVTVQLPIFNEQFVVERLLDAVAAFDYPRDRLQIQVLDDSTDETVDIVRRKIAVLENAQPDLDIMHVRRTNRIGFKAGALEAALAQATGEYIAIFDADFLPQSSFLNQTLPHFDAADVAAVQTCWQHINEDYSLLTRLQAFMLDYHFSCEQCGRCSSGYFLNFNGTAGIWRREAIENSGSWEHDTLAEDTDLSYRAQLKGWRLKYVESIGTPSEVPATMDAVRSQQFRWTKGIAAVGRKCLGQVWKSRSPLIKKIHASVHLLLSGTYLCTLLAAVMTVPVLLFAQRHPEVYVATSLLLSTIGLGLVAIAFAFWVSRRHREKHLGWRRFVKFLWLYPTFISYYMGISLHNALAAIEGFAGIRSPFVRTPKLNLTGDGMSLRSGHPYLTARLPRLFFVEALFGLYFAAGIVLDLVFWDLRFLVYHVQLFFGFGLICYFTLRSAWEIAHLPQAEPADASCAAEVREDFQLAIPSQPSKQEVLTTVL